MTAFDVKSMQVKDDEETGRVGLTHDAQKKNWKLCLCVVSVICGAPIVDKFSGLLLVAQEMQAPVGRNVSSADTVNLFKPELHPGSCVELAGMQNPNSRFNGLPGICEEFNTRYGRWWVRMKSGTVYMSEERYLKPVLHQGCWVQVNGLKNRKQERFNGQQGEIRNLVRYPWCPGCWRVNLQSGRSVNVRPANINSIEPPHFASTLPLITKSGAPAPASALIGKVVALYFSAHWCPFCLKFTPKLHQFYNTMKDCGDNMQIIFVSGDKTQKEFEDYYHNDHGDWLAIEYGSPEILRLRKHYKLTSWPTLVVVDKTGKIVVPTDYAIGGVVTAVGTRTDHRVIPQWDEKDEARKKIVSTYALWKDLGW